MDPYNPFTRDALDVHESEAREQKRDGVLDASADVFRALAIAAAVCLPIYGLVAFGQWAWSVAPWR